MDVPEILAESVKPMSVEEPTLTVPEAVLASQDSEYNLDLMFNPPQYGTPEHPGTQCVASPKNVEGLAPGRIVAYWPHKHEQTEEGGLQVPGAHNYLPAMILATWAKSGTSQLPAVNLVVFPYHGTKLVSRSSVVYSEVPTMGHWTWIPKA